MQDIKNEENIYTFFFSNHQNFKKNTNLLKQK